MDPSCTALAPHGTVGTVRIPVGTLDAYGLPDFDAMDFDGEAMAIVDKPQPKRRKPDGVVSCANKKLDNLCGIVCTWDNASPPKSPARTIVPLQSPAHAITPAAKESAKRADRLKLKNSPSSIPKKMIKPKEAKNDSLKQLALHALHAPSPASATPSAAKLSDEELEKLDLQLLQSMDPVPASHHGVIKQA